MKPAFSEQQKELCIKLAETLVLILLTFLVCYFNLFSSFEKLLLDSLYQKPRGINNRIKIIAIDKQTLREIGAMGTWSRQVYADLLDKLGDYPDIVVMDLMLFGDMDAAGDQALREACSRNPYVISGCYINYSSVYRYTEDGKGYIATTTSNPLTSRYGRRLPDGLCEYPAGSGRRARCLFDRSL